MSVASLSALTNKVVFSADSWRVLHAPLTNIKGVGEKGLEALIRLLGQPNGMPPCYLDLLFHTPTQLLDRRKVTLISQAEVGERAVVKARILEHFASPGRFSKRPYRILVEDESAALQLVFFNAKSDYVQRDYPVGAERLIAGMVDMGAQGLQIVHPEAVTPPEKASQFLRLEPVYPMTYALSAYRLRQWMGEALRQCPALPEWIDNAMLAQRDWAGWRESLWRLHHPMEPEDILPDAPATSRLAYDELLANQLALALMRRKQQKQPGIRLNDVSASVLRQQIINRLPFTLTEAQQQVLKEIDADFASGNRMLRLLQGDVGSGKTLVALLAMLPLMEAGYQCVLMAPTDILARQHMETLRPLLVESGHNSLFLSGKLGAGEKRSALQAIANGEVSLIIGTHALFQEKVTYQRLGMIVVDEQHRFGVNQRLALSEKGEMPHVLLMTATPIPRSLALTAYGDMDSSQLLQKPKGRQPIETRTISIERVAEVVDGLRRAISEGQKAYWICPLIEEDEILASDPTNGDIAAVMSRYEVLKAIFGEKVAVVHGRIPPAERAAILDDFAADNYDILVATTVVEVGVNVPSATIMVIEQAQRFGLAQLHQLRGRVGRGEKASHCLLLYDPKKCSDIARERLKIIRASQDGFLIAEEDLRLRGAGEVLGTRQSGLPAFYFADLALHRQLVSIAREDVKYILHQDAQLQSPRGQALKLLLKLFRYEESLRFLQAG